MNQPQYPEEQNYSLTVPQQGSVLVAQAQQPGDRALAAQVQATVQARYVMAMQRPRSMDQVRSELIHECRRPRFAEVAIYHKPVGGGIEGPSIRFAEAVCRSLGNMLPESLAIFDDQERRVVRVTVTDLERNNTYSQDVTIRKTVERNKVRRGQEVVGTREGSGGQTVYVVKASDDELAIREAAMVSKALRTLILRHLPRDILDECMDTCRATMRSNDAQDPDATKRRLVDGFGELGIKPRDIEEYLGHSLDQTTPAELGELRPLYAALRDGETTWKKALGERLEVEDDAPPAKGVAGLKAALSGEKKED